MTNIMNWIIGPQLIGIIFLIAGLISIKFPPKKINQLYGYRSPSSMKNQQTWDEANRFSSRYLVRLGLILVMIGLLISFIFNAEVLPIKLEILLRPVLLIGTAMASAVILIVTTEKHLAKTFDKELR
jgi:uncharacterized membrane protein